MKRRNFIENTALCAIAISTAGNIHFDGNGYTGDCETTTDILGPFYRPDSPIRNNLIVKGDLGKRTELSGIVRHKDCVTPYKNAKIELWHCNSEGVYDNASEEYNYRGTTFTDDHGKYLFNTILPVPYGARPAHFHLMISAEGYQPLVTQLYFTGDPGLSKDASSSSPTAAKRILPVLTRKDGTRKVVYNVGMSEIVAPDPPVLDKLAGFYIGASAPKISFNLSAKNKQVRMGGAGVYDILTYVGNNTFQLAGANPYYLLFEIMPSGSINAIMTVVDKEGKKKSYVYMKQE